MATIDVNGMPQIMNALQRISVETGVSLKKLCENEMRLWLVDLVKRSAGRPGESLGAQRRENKEAIENELNRIFIHDEDTLELWAIMIQAEEMGPEQPYIVHLTKTGAMFLTDMHYYRPMATIPEMAKFHDSQRTKHGKVTKAGSYDQMIGRWKALNKMYVQKTTYDRFVKWRQSHVGTIKAGWLEAHDYYARKVGAKIPTWKYIRDNKHRAQGAKITNMDDYGTGTLGAINQVSYAGDAIQDGLIRSTQRQREKNLVRATQGRMRQITKQFGRTA